ncbi:MAG: esterase [Chitinophagaceae bacterium]|nr:MAG: esterase [Chitinophagaceae bacterium]
MNIKTTLLVSVEKIALKSKYLLREVQLDIYTPQMEASESLELLLINDGQDLPKMPFDEILNDLYSQKLIKPFIAVGIYCGEDRKMEYGMVSATDYLGRGAKAGLYNQFILEELIPFLLKNYNITHQEKISFAGFSLGGLCALDIVWNYPQFFYRVGVFSGSLWWRSIDQDDVTYDDDKHRLMQQQIRNTNYKPGLKFFFQCGLMDEKKDRNHNGVIDAVDDTRDHVRELIKKGYTLEDVTYMELDEGRHDVPSWAKAFPAFLKWGWGL